MTRLLFFIAVIVVCYLPVYNAGSEVEVTITTRSKGVVSKWHVGNFTFVSI